MRDADGIVRATLTTTFDGTRYNQTYAPADGEAQTAIWDATQNPDAPVQKVSGDETLRPFTMDMDNLGTGVTAGGPAVVAGGMLGLAFYALMRNSQDQGKPAPIEARPPRDEDNEDDNTGGRKRRGHRDGPRPLQEGEVYQPPEQTSDPANPAKSSEEDKSTPPQLTKPRRRPHELSDQEIEDIGNRIGRGHASETQGGAGRIPRVRQ